jgi:hypothetical protein
MFVNVRLSLLSNLNSIEELGTISMKHLFLMTPHIGFMHALIALIALITLRTNTKKIQRKPDTSNNLSLITM